MPFLLLINIITLKNFVTVESATTITASPQNIIKTRQKALKKKAKIT